MESIAHALPFVSWCSSVIILISIVLISTGFPNSSPSRRPVRQFKFTSVLPYVKGVSEPLGRYPQQQGTRAVSCPTQHLDCIYCVFPDRSQHSFGYFANSQGFIFSYFSVTLFLYFCFNILQIV